MSSSGYDSSGGLIVSGQKIFNSAVATNVVVLTSSNSITIDASQGNIFYLPLAVGNTVTFNAPSNPTNGQQITLLINHTVANNTGSWNSVWYWPAGVKPTLSQVISTVDVVSAVYSTNITGSGAWISTFGRGFM